MAHTWTFTVDSVAASPTLTFGVSFYADGTKYTSQNITVASLPSNDSTGILSALTPVVDTIIAANKIAWEAKIDSTALASSLSSAVASISSTPEST